MKIFLLRTNRSKFPQAKSSLTGLPWPAQHGVNTIWYVNPESSSACWRFNIICMEKIKNDHHWRVRHVQRGLSLMWKPSQSSLPRRPTDWTRYSNPHLALKSTAKYFPSLPGCPSVPMKKGARLRVRTIFCLILKIKFRCSLRGPSREFAAGLSCSFIFFSRDPVPNGPQRAERSRRAAAPDLGAPVASFMCLMGGCRNRTTASEHPAKDAVWYRS